MAFKLAEGEVVVKEYDYSKSIIGQLKSLTSQSRLIVTNKRIVDERTCYASRNERIIRNEIPVEKATTVSTSFRRQGNFFWLLLCMISVFATIGCLAVSFVSDLLGSSKGVATISLGFLGMAILFGVLYIFLRKSAVKLLIATDSYMTPILGISTVTKSRRSKKARGDMSGSAIKISLNAKVAMALVDEIGAAILDAKNYVEAPVKVPVEVPAEVAIEAPVEAPDEAPVEVVIEAPVEELELSDNSI